MQSAILEKLKIKPQPKKKEQYAPFFSKSEFVNPQSRGDLHHEGENQSASLPVEPSLVKSSAGFALDCN